MLISAHAIRLSLGAAAASALLAIPLACSDDTTPGTTPEAGTGSGGDEGTGGKPSTGGKAGGGGATATGGMMSSGGQSGAAGAGGGAKGGSDAGGPETGPGVPDAEPPGTPDSSIDGGHDAGPPPCSPPENPNDAKVCLTWKPDNITPVTSDENLDLVGVMIIQFFDTPNPATGAEGLKGLIFYPPLPDGGGLNTINIHDLPQIDIDGLPETVYMRVVFVDNVPGFFSNPTTLTWGCFAGGFDLTAGVVPRPALRALPLKKGAGTMHLTTLTALRKFTIGSVELATGTTPPDDGQGPLSIGAFNTDLPSGAPVLGGVELGCKDITAGPISNVQGFLYGPGDNGNFWIGAQLDDYNQGGTIKPGFIVSLGGPGGQTIMDSQKVTLTPDQYSVTVPKVSLNYVIPISGTPPAHYACPAPQ